MSNEVRHMRIGSMVGFIPCHCPKVKDRAEQELREMLEKCKERKNATEENGFDHTATTIGNG